MQNSHQKKLESRRLVYINGKYVPENEAKISIFDSALMFGDMVFEMTRSFNKKQFKLKEHLERLLYGVKIYRIPLNLDISELEKICLETVERNDEFFESTDEHRLMINISRGPLGIYAPIFNNKIEPTVVVADFPLKWTVASMGKLYDEGVNAVLVSQRAIPAHLMDPKIKNRSRVFYQLANIEASKIKGENNWALLLDENGRVAEGTGCNFFIIKNNKILTPKGVDGLIGISRNYIFELCEQLKLECLEADIEPFHVYDADEAFMTATPFCLLPVKSLNSVIIGDGKFGKISKKLIEKWSENVGVNIIDQLKSYNKKEDNFKNSIAPTPYKFK